MKASPQIGCNKERNKRKIYEIKYTYPGYILDTSDLSKSFPNHLRAEWDQVNKNL